MLERRDQALRACEDPSELLFILEKDLTVELQKRRPELFFLHAAALALGDRAILLAAESGSGKSTTAWGLLHHGFRYLTDELSAIDLDALAVYPYPHALCLKRRPPVYPLPEATIDLGSTLHVPTSALPTPPVLERCPLAAVFLLRYEPATAMPEVRRLTPAEASARLYVTVLNALAHERRGLDAVARLAQALPCFFVTAGELSATCASIRSATEHALAPGA
jgi:hypothetical protein